MNPEKNIERLIEELILPGTEAADERILNDALAAFRRTCRSEGDSVQPSMWRTIVKSRITKLSAAAVITIAVVFSVSILDTSMPIASAAEILAEAVEAVSNLKSVHIKAQIRTTAHDNFELIGLDYDFVPNEIWKQFDETEHGKWRIEKPGRIVVMDGESSVLLLVRSKRAMKDGVNTGFVQWLKPLLDVDRVLDREILLAEEQGSELQLSHEQGLDGRDKLIVTVEAVAQGEFVNDWCKNASISESDNRRVYWFDAETNLLEGLEVYVHTEDEDVLILEITDIEYNLDIDPILFTLDLPEKVIWLEQPKKVPDGDSYEDLTPRQVARAFFQACANEDWDEFVKFFLISEVDQHLKNIMGGLEIISVGKPFKSGLWPGWLVPCEIKRRHEEESNHYNLAVRYDEIAKRYIVTGGF